MYDEFCLIPNILRFFLGGCSDTKTKLRQTSGIGLKSVATLG